MRFAHFLVIIIYKGEAGGAVDVKTSTTQDSKTKLSVTLSAEEIKPYIDEMFKKLNKTRIPGFRPGKTPRKILERHCGGHAAIYGEIAENAINTYAPRALDSQNLYFVATPDWDDLEPLEDGKSYTFTFSGKTKPEMEILSDDPVKVTIPVPAITDDYVEKEVDRIRGFYTSSSENEELTDEEFAKKAGVKDLKELKEEIKKSLEAQREEAIEGLKENKCIEELAKRLHGEVAQSYINFTRNDILREFYQNLQKAGQTFDMFLNSQGITRSDFDEDLSAQAKEVSAQQLALDALAKMRGIEVTDEDINEQFKASSAPESTRKTWEDQGKMTTLREAILRQKALSWLVDNADVTIKDTDPNESEKDSEEKKSAKGKADTNAKAKKDTKTSAKTSAKSTKADSTKKSASAKSSAKSTSKSAASKTGAKTGASKTTSKAAAKTGAKKTTTKKSTAKKATTSSKATSSKAGSKTASTKTSNKSKQYKRKACA